MDARPSEKFPHLNHFLNAYMHQDWDMYGDTWEEVVKTYLSDVSLSEGRQLAAEIEDFLTAEGDRIEDDFSRLYPNSVMSSGWGMSTAEWLRQVANAIGNRVLAH